MTQTEMITPILQVTITAGILLILVISTDSFSGERDRSTLEALLLTPIPRRHIALGKFLAPISLWAGLLLISIPYIVLLGRGTGLIGHFVALEVIIGTLLVVGFYFLGIIVSTFSHSNLMSFTLSLFSFFVLFAPMQLSGAATTSPVGRIILKRDPVTAGINYMAATIANGGNWTRQTQLLIAPIMFFIVMIVMGLFIVDRFLNLNGGRLP